MKDLLKTILVLVLLSFSVSLHATQSSWFIVSSNDDAEQDGSNSNKTDSDTLDLNDEDYIGVRFTGITISKGASITSAKIIFRQRKGETDSGDFQVDIFGESVDNATHYNNTTKLKDRSKTTASVVWFTNKTWSSNAKGPDTTTPDIKTIVQEIVNRDGWAQGNALSFILKKDTGNNRRPGSIDRGITYRAELIINYEEYIPPVVSDSSVTLNKNSLTGTVVGTVPASPAITKIEIISGNEDGIFSIDNAGIVTLVDSVKLSSSSTTQYILRIKATNPYGTGTGDFTINVTTEPIVTTDGRNFDIRNPIDTRNIRGDFQVIGNTVLCVHNTSGNCYDYTGTSRNNNLDLHYIDVDSTANTFNNSSQATIDIPTTAVVKWAALYTQGHLSGTSLSSSTLNAPAQAAATTLLKDPVKLSIPGITSTVNAVPQYIDYLTDSSRRTYSAISVIPEMIGKLGSTINGVLTVANVKAYEGQESSGLGNFGAWTMVIVYEDQDASLKNISIFDGYKIVRSGTTASSVDITIDGFLTPTSGNVNSKLSIFAGEGDKNIDGDTLSFNNTDIGYEEADGTNNAFSSNVNGFTRYPDYSNNQGIDIQNYDIGSTGLNLVSNNDSQAVVNLTSNGDYYYPSLIAFSADLYEPRVCYNQEFYNEDGSPLTDINIGDTILVETWISNMKKLDPITGLPEDGNLETADKVEITMELDTEFLEFTALNASTTNIFDFKNIDGNTFASRVYVTKTNDQADDEIDLIDTNSTKWRVGIGASVTDGGQLLPNTAPSDDLIAFVRFKVKLLKEGDIDINNIYTVSYANSQLGVRFGDDSPLNIGVCADFNSSIGVSGLLGAYNVVNESGGGSAYNDASSSQTSLSTQVAGRPFTVKIISVDSAGSALIDKTENITVSLIANPYGDCTSADNECKQTACDGASAIAGTSPITVNFNGTAQLQSFTYNLANKNAMFKIDYNSGSAHACSLDSFALRPEKFTLVPSEENDIELLRSGTTYFLTLKAVQDSTTTVTSGYTLLNVDSSVLAVSDVKYKPDGAVGAGMVGTFNFAPNGSFNILNGISDSSGINEIVTMNFDDVGLINLKLQDQTWAQVDIDNGDTIADCSANGAYVCGDINATFIPDHFAVTAVTLNNYTDAGAQNFTYLSNDLNISAALSLSITAKNSLNGTTQNFDNDSWENNITTVFNVIGTATTANRNEIAVPKDLDFASGVQSISNTETNTSKNLIFNFARVTNTPQNPFVVNGADVNIIVNSLYTSSTANTATITGNSLATASATFVYGRTHAPRQRFVGNSDAALIYYETFCDGAGCDKLLLPNSISSTSTDDPRWFVNTNHFPAAGVVGTVNQKNNAEVTAGTPVGAATANVVLTYDATRGYPFKTTMENNASTWLRYDKYKADPVATNEFEVEFTDGNTSWAGQHETDTTTNTNSSDKTNRRIMW